MWPDGCAPLLYLGDAYKRGLLSYERVRANINGRIACHRESVGVIAQVVWNCQGAHLEIGTLFGGTAIVAALARANVHVTCIDPLDGYYGLKRDPMAAVPPSVDVVNQNLEKFGVRERVSIVAARSSPWPLPEGAQFDSCLIDGDHSKEGAYKDWLNVKGCVSRYAIFDNVDGKHPGVLDVFKEACTDPDWRPVLVYDIMGVVERC